MVKTERFSKPAYLGDPINAVRIFNEKEVDELVILDIDATRNNLGPNLELLEEIVSEAFMPISYGGGIMNLEISYKLLRLGIEKLILRSALGSAPNLVRQMVCELGSQAVVACLDFELAPDGMHRWRYPVLAQAIDSRVAPSVEYVESLGVGELLVTSIDKEGTRSGMDIALAKDVLAAASRPVILNGGASSLDDLLKAVTTGVDAVAAGALFVFSGPHKAVMINYPTQEQLRNVFASKL